MSILRILLLAVLAGSFAPAQFPTFYVGEVLDAASYTRDIARGSIFVVKGNGLCPPGLRLGAPPYKDSEGGVSVELTPSAGGVSTKALILHTYGGVQVAAILPSNVPAGTYRLTVSYGGRTTSPFTTTVVNRKFRLLTNNSQGFGTAAAQNWVGGGRVDRNMFAAGTLQDDQTKGPAQPGQTMILWGTGLGPIDKPDAEPPGSIDLRDQVQVFAVVGGQRISPDYAGRSPQYSGVDQINFTLPSDVSFGCNVPLQVLVDNQGSNIATLSIAPAGAAACEHPQLTAAHLERLDQGEALTVGLFNLSSQTLPLDATNTVFGRIDEIEGYFFPLNAETVSRFTDFAVPPGRCLYFRIRGTEDEIVPGGVPFFDSADAGTVGLTGPNLSNRDVDGDEDYYYLLLAAREERTGMSLGAFNNFPLTPGTYTLRGPGGSYVGSFEASVALPEILRWTNRDETREVRRDSGLLVTWTGGSPTDQVIVTGFAGTIVGGSSSDPELDGGLFYCTGVAGDSSLVVPPDVLGRLPAAANDSSTSIGALSVLSAPRSPATKFNATLVNTGEIDTGIFTYRTRILKSLPYR